MIRVFYDAGALFIDGRDDPIMAGTLTASAAGSTVSISSLHGTKPLVSCDFSLIATVAGTGFGSVGECLAYLAGQFAMRRPVSFEAVNQAPSTSWTIAHGLGFRPNVMTFDTTGEQIFGVVSYPDVDTVLVVFSSPTSGSAYLS